MGEWKAQTTGCKICSEMYHTTWGYSQYIVITVNGKESLKIALKFLMLKNK